MHAFDRQTDGQTDGRTDRILIARPRLHSMQRGKNERTVTIIMAGCIAYARNGHISTFDLKSDVPIVFLDPDFLKDAKILAIPP